MVMSEGGRIITAGIFAENKERVNIFISKTAVLCMVYKAATVSLWSCDI